MNILLKVLFSLSISGSLLILFLFLCKPLCKKILTRKWQYYIWIIVIARLLIPVAPEYNLVGALFQSIQTPKAITALTFSDLDYSSATEKYFLEEETVNMIEDFPNTFPSFSSPSFFVSDIFSFLAENLFFIWLGIALILLIRKITIYQSFLSYIKAGRTEVSDISLLNRFSELEDSCGIKRMIELYTNELISSPLLIGFFHPCIVLPSTNISSTDFDYTILHELTHYRQMDLFYKWLVQLTVCLHWFNPFVYLMAREINHACELSCDEAVIQDLDEDGMQAYGDTLLHAVKIKGTYKSSVASVTLTESKELLMERLAAIMDFKKPTVKFSVAAVLCTIFMVFSSAAAGAYPISANPKINIEVTSAKTKAKNPYFSDSPVQIISDTVMEASYENAIDYDAEGIFIMEDSGTWGETFDDLLPYMTSDAIEEAVEIYLTKHLFYNSASNSNIKLVADTISKAYPYMTEESLKRLAYFIIDSYGVWDENFNTLLPYINYDSVEEIINTNVEEIMNHLLR